MRLIIFSLIFAISGTLTAQSRIEGNIVHHDSGEPIPGVNIFVPELNRGSVSRADGSFWIDDLPAGHLKVQISFIGYKTVFRELRLGEKDTLVLRQSMKPVVLQSEEVVISAGTYTTQHQQSVKVEVLSAEKLKNTQTATAMEKLEGIPGVSMVSKGPGVVKPVLRGMLNSNILVLLDGVRMENFQFSENHPYMIDDAGIARVEVIKGPASLYYGSDAIGGVINFISKDPRMNEGIHTSIGASWHSVSAGEKVNGELRGRHGNFLWKAFGSKTSHKDYRDGNDNIVPNSRFDQTNAGLSTAWSSGNFSSAVTYMYNASQFGMAVGPAFSLVDTEERKLNNWYQDLDYHFVRNKSSLVLGAYTLSASLAYQHNHRRLYTLEEYSVDMKLDNLSWDISTRRHGKDDGEWVFGIQGNHKQNLNQEAEERVVPDHDQHDLSAYLITDRAITSRLRTQLGLRLDMRNLDVPEQEAGGHDHGEEGHEEEEEEEHHEIEALEKDYLNLSGSAGLVYDLGREMVLRLSLSSAFRNPTVPELTQDGLHGARYEQGNRRLSPQQAFQADLGWHWHGERLAIDVNVFMNSIRDYIFLSPTMDTLDDGDRIFRYAQTDALLYGAETRATLDVGKGLQFMIAGTMLRGEQSDGSPLPFIPQDALHAGLEYNGKQKKGLRPTAGVKVMHYLPQDRPGFGETSTDAYTLVNAYFNLHYALNDHRFHLGIALKNALDEAYIDHLSTLKGTPYYQVGRNFMVSLRYEI